MIYDKKEGGFSLDSAPYLKHDCEVMVLVPQ